MKNNQEKTKLQNGSIHCGSRERERERESHTLVTKKCGGFNLTRNGGITLIGLVITVVIMLILTGITINLLFGDNGIITKTKMAKKAFLGEDAREVVEDRVNAYLAEYGTKGELSLYDFWFMYNSQELEDGSKNPNYDKNFVIYLFEEDWASVGFTPQVYKKGAPYTSAVVIYKGYSVTLDTKLTVKGKAKAVEDLTETQIAKLKDLTPEDVHGSENEGIPGISKWDSKKGIQTPQLAQGMVPVKWADTNNDEIEDSWVVCSTTDSDWYNYKAQTDTTTCDSKWANVMLMDGLRVTTTKELTIDESDITIGTLLTNEQIKSIGGTPGEVAEKLDGAIVSSSTSQMGSMFVWIPRYEYKIASPSTSGYDVGGIIDVNFIPKKTNSVESNATYTTASCATQLSNGIYVTAGTVYNTSTEYIIHPAFINEYSNDSDNTNDFLNGGWDSELPGIWVAKFEASAYTSVTGSETNFSSSSPSTVSTYMVRILPGVISWKNTIIGDMYTACRNITGSKAANYGLTADSNQSGTTYAHLMKNSEWGAVAYLTHSKYGRNGIEVSRNNYSGYPYTGGNSGTSYILNGAQSTTGNVTGIYDLRGGTAEYVAAYGSGCYQNGGDMLQGGNTKYKTIYSVDTEKIPSYIGCKTGDATYEVYIGKDSSESIYKQKAWFNDYSINVIVKSEFNSYFLRGGCGRDSYYNSKYNGYSGIFSSNGPNGSDNSENGFRPVLVVITL